CHTRDSEQRPINFRQSANAAPPFDHRDKLAHTMHPIILYAVWILVGLCVTVAQPGGGSSEVPHKEGCHQADHPEVQLCSGLCEVANCPSRIRQKKRRLHCTTCRSVTEWEVQQPFCVKHTPIEHQLYLSLIHHTRRCTTQHLDTFFIPVKAHPTTIMYGVQNVFPR
ncbi:hypothetical protein MJO29_002054, partial [Puccinia striiformis f. sp. tritici]